MNNQAFSKIWIVIIAVLIIAGGILAWQYFGELKEEVELPEEKTEEVIEDETTDWKVYGNEEYGFEFKYSENWKQCGIHSSDVSLELFRLTGAEQNCSVGLYDKPTDVFIITVESNIFETYPSYSELKKSLEEAKLSVDKLFNISHEKYGQLGLFEVGEIKEITVNDKSALQVEQISPIGAGSSTGIYILHKENLFRISYSLVSSIREGEVNQMFSTFRFLE